jgi:MtrB/PioB family decaheme-associated outer membrane protein
MIASTHGKSRLSTTRGVTAFIYLLLYLGLAPSITAAASTRESALSGSGIESTREVDSRGLTTWRTTRHRSPSGILYPYPLKPLPWGGEAFQIRSSVDIGFIANDGEADEAAFRKYADRSDGVLVRRFLLEGQQRDTAYHFEIGGGSVGRSDQFFYVELGQHGLFRLRGGFDSLEHLSMGDARVLFGGVGSELLTLPAPLVPGLNTQTDVNAALATTGRTRLSQKREETEVELRLAIHPRLTLIADYQLREREGERPFGGTLGLTFSAENAGSVAETIAPEESNTHNFSAALQYADRNLQANLRYRGSIYDNQNSSLTWENPFSAFEVGGTAFQGVPRGRAALAPDNQLHQITSDFGVELPLNSRFTTHVAWTRMRQNQRLLPATINADITAFSSLSRSKADAQVDQLLVQSKIRVRPISAVSLDFGFRYSMRDNDTNYLSFNPASGQFGYVTEDESLTNRRGAVPFSMRRYRVNGSVDWRFAKRSKVGLSFQHEAVQRKHRARQEVRDDQVRVHASTALIPYTQLRLSYSYLQRSGSSYSPSRDARYYEAPGPGFPPRTGGPTRSLQNFRQFDLGSQSSHDVALRANWLIGPSIDLSLSGRYENRDYRASYGVTGSRLGEISLDTSIQISPRLVGHAFASFEWRDRRMASINGAIGLGPSTDFAAGSARFPLPNRWVWDSDLRGITLGAGFTAQPHTRLELRADYRFQRSHEVVDTEFDRTGGALTPLSDPTIASSRFPTLKQIDHIVDVSARYRWTDAISTRVFYRFQYATIEDFHQQGLQPVVNQNLFLGHVDDDFAVHVMGATCQLRY